MMKLSLKAKMTIFVLISLFLSLVIVSGTLMYRSYYYTNDVMNESIEENYLIFDTIMDQENLRLAALVEAVASSSLLQESLSQYESQEAQELIKDESYNYHLTFAKKFATNMFTIYSPDMKSVYYSNNSTGEDPQSDPFLHKALETKKRLDEKSTNQHGMVLRSIGPIYNASSELVGFIEIAKYFDNAYFDQLVHATGTEVTIYNNNESVVSTTFDINLEIPNTPEERMVGRIIEDEEILETVLENGEVLINQINLENGRNILGGYYPIKSANDEIRGALYVGVPIDKYKEQQKDDVIITSVIFLVLLIVVGSITLLYMYRKLSPISNLSSTVSKFSDYDYRSSFNKNFLKQKDEIGEMSRSLSLMQENTRRLIEGIQGSSVDLTSSADGLLILTEQNLTSIEEVISLLDGINKSVELENINLKESSIALDNTANGVSEIVSTVNDFAEEIQNVNKHAQSGTSLIQSSVEKFDEITDNSSKIKVTVSELVSSLQDITKFVAMIKDIAEQTNLLSLNASIEAARAGENGKGFAVVAKEIRSLAAQSSKASEDINKTVSIISESSKRSIESLNRNESGVKEGLTLISRIVSSFSTIDASVKELSSQAENLLASSQEISASIEEVNSSVSDIENLSQKNKDSVSSIVSHLDNQKKGTEELVTSSRGLTELADNLTEKADLFKL